MSAGDVSRILKNQDYISIVEKGKVIVLPYYRFCFAGKEGVVSVVCYTPGLVDFVFTWTTFQNQVLKLGHTFTAVSSKR